MPTFTSRLGLIKQAGGEDVDVDLLNANFDRLDEYAQVKIVTSTTRPTGTDRFPGAQIYETDTDRIMMWTGTAWTPLRGDWYIERYKTGANLNLPASTYTDLIWTDTRDDNTIVPGRRGTAADWGLTDFDEDKAAIAVPESGLYHVYMQIRLSASTVARTLRLRTASEQVGAQGANNDDSFISAILPIAKGGTVIASAFVPSLTALSGDGRTASDTRSFIRVARIG
jgi:hypothetical protein